MIINPKNDSSTSDFWRISGVELQIFCFFLVLLSTVTSYSSQSLGLMNIRTNCGQGTVLVRSCLYTLLLIF